MENYMLAEDVDAESLAAVMELAVPGVVVENGTVREYNTTYAAHILGYIGPIWSEEAAEYREKGYSMNALVGKSGVEQAFEEYLHGSSGIKRTTVSSTGEILNRYYVTEPVPGNNVELTIDISLQAVAEQALEKVILDLRENGVGRNKEGKDAQGGAVVVQMCKTGEILAMASYPTYDLATRAENAVALNEDETAPMFNRALAAYPPGSVYKMVTAIAGLEEGIITPSTIIEDKGIYTYYVDPQPMCWIWRQAHTTHGRINVSQAIVDSCNYFYYEVGRLTGIKKLDEYATAFGLGQSTGIEIGDVSGVLASPEWAEAHDREWTDGQTITAAIGQSYNLFTPLQLANYVATLVSGGEHYEAHLLKNVKSYDNSRVVGVYGKGPLNDLNISDSTMAAVTKGMHDLTYDSLRSAFSRCVVEAGAKTGSAQVGTDIANGTFVAYAPYDDPEIAVAIVIEHATWGSNLATTGVDILNAYFTADETGSAVTGENQLLP